MIKRYESMPDGTLVLTFHDLYSNEDVYSINGKSVKEGDIIQFMGNEYYFPGLRIDQKASIILLGLNAKKFLDLIQETSEIACKQ